MKRILAACVLLLMGTWAAAQVNGQGGVYINGVLQGGGGSSYSYLWSGGISMLAPTTDVAPDPLFLRGANAFPGATVNTTGANTILAGGIGRRIFTVVAYNNGTMADSTITVVENGESFTITEGVEWDAETSEAVTATNIAAAIVNSAQFIQDATAVGAVVRIVPGPSVYSLTIAKTAADAGMTATSGTDGAISTVSALNSYAAAGEANPTARLASGGISFGPGGASAVDTVLDRRSSGTLWLRLPSPSTTLANLHLGSMRFFGVTGGGNMMEMGNSGINIRATLPISWSATENSDGPFDIGLVRSAVGVVKVTDGSTGNGKLQTAALLIPHIADAVLQFGTIVMADAGTDGRFDVNPTNGTLAIGVLTGTGASAQGTEYGIAVAGKAYIVPVTGLTITRGEVIYQSATAGYGQNNSALQAAGKNVGIALYSEAMYTAATANVDLDLNTFKLSSAPGWAIGDPVVYYNGGGASATGMTTAYVYWVAGIASDVISVSLTKGGTAVDISGTGNNAQFFQRLPLCMINIR